MLSFIASLRTSIFSKLSLTRKYSSSYYNNLITGFKFSVSCSIFGLNVNVFECGFLLYSYQLAEECADDDDDKSAIRKLRKRVKHKLKTLDTLVRVSLLFLKLSFPISVHI